MYYVSNKKFRDGQVVWGIVDTKDGVEEFYDIPTITNLIETYGLTVSGAFKFNKYYECRPSSYDEAYMSTLNLCDVVVLNICGNVCNYLYIGKSESGYWVFDGKDAKEIRYNALVDGRVKVSGIVTKKDVQLSLMNLFCEKYPKHGLVQKILGVSK